MTKVIIVFPPVSKWTVFYEPATSRSGRDLPAHAGREGGFCASPSALFTGAVPKLSLVDWPNSWHPRAVWSHLRNCKTLPCALPLVAYPHIRHIFPSVINSRWEKNVVPWKGWSWNIVQLGFHTEHSTSHKIHLHIFVRHTNNLLMVVPKTLPHHKCSLSDT